jgi:hypothetical protein
VLHAKEYLRVFYRTPDFGVSGGEVFLHVTCHAGDLGHFCLFVWILYILYICELSELTCYILLFSGISFT